MANSIITYTGDGVTVQYAVNFTLGVLRREYVTCQVNNEVDGLGDPVYRTLEWVSDGLVNIQGDVPINGASIVFKRTMPKDELIHDYSDGVPILEANLDDSNKQTLMSIHEFLDGRLGDGFTQDIDMNGYKIINLGAGEDDTDAATVEQLNDAMSAVEADLAAAEAARIAAELAETNAEAAEVAAETAQALAEDWATQLTTAVAGGEFSAKENAVGDSVTTGSSKNWAMKTSAAVVTGLYSAKEWAIGLLTRGTSGGGSAKDWANYTAGVVDDTAYSSKAHATGGTGVTNVTGAAKEWAAKAEDSTVDGVLFSALHYSAKASDSAITAAASAVSADVSADNAENYSLALVNRWAYSTTTSMANPTTGKLRFNNATLASATALAISALSGDSGNPNLRTWIASWDDSTNTNKGTITVTKSGHPEVFAIYSITGALTDNTTWLQLVLSYVTGAGALANNDEVFIRFSRSGDANAADFSTNTAVSADGEVVLFSGTGGKTGKRATGSGLAKLTSGVLGIGIAGTDYYAPGGTAIAVVDGGLGLSTLPANNIILGNGTSAPLFVAPGNASNVLTSNGTTWVSSLPTIVSSITGFLPSSIAGTSTTASLSVSAGLASNTTNTRLISKATTTSWAVSNGNAANGYQGGATLPNNSTIHFYVITNSSNGSPASFASTSLTPTLPTAYSGGFYRRIFSMNTNSSGVLLPYTAIENEGGGLINWLTTQTLDISTTVQGTSRINYTLNVPSGIKVQPLTRANAGSNAGSTNIILLSGDETSTVPPSYVSGGWSAAAGADFAEVPGLTTVQPFITTNTSGQIGVQASAASSHVNLVTRGWVDFRRG